MFVLDIDLLVVYYYRVFVFDESVWIDVKLTLRDVMNFNHGMFIYFIFISTYF